MRENTRQKHPRKGNGLAYMNEKPVHTYITPNLRHNYVKIGLSREKP